MHLLQAHHDIKNSVDETAVNIQHHVTPPWPTLAHPIPLSHPWVFRTLVVYRAGVLRADSMPYSTPSNRMSQKHSQGSRLAVGPCREWVLAGIVPV